VQHHITKEKFVIILIQFFLIDGLAEEEGLSDHYDRFIATRLLFVASKKQSV